MDPVLLAGERVKPTWVTRHVPGDLVFTWREVGAPQAGDLLLCEVKKTGLHGRVETRSGSRRKIYSGDRIVCALANRYATALLEAVAEVDGKRAHMVAASGLCGRIVAGTAKASNPTELVLVAQAYVGDNPLNLRMLRLPPASPPAGEPRWIIVVGSSMDSGKTTACTSIIRGLVDAGHAVGAAKITGTASGRDFGAYGDAGAVPVVDFLDAGYASTVGCGDNELANLAADLASYLRAASIEYGVIEIADGLLQHETRALLSLIGQIFPRAELVVTARESISAASAIADLRALGHTPVAASGLLTNSPLVAREVELAASLPAIRTAELGKWFAKRAVVPTDAEPLPAPTV
jgi:hypothetical protein